ncbi:MAG: exodeoxyribonuclease V subunit gamma, partial [Rubrivivax sp.]
RDDDRQLMLDALLAARDRLHVSWSAHRARDNQPQPPSVLVQQLRDHVAALWGADALAAVTVSHPLQPFSRAYVEDGGDARLFTHAHEWRALHEPPSPPPPAASWGPPTAPPAAPRAVPAVLPLKRLSEFVRRPVEAYFRERLRADLRRRDESIDDDEPFAAGGLQGWQWRDEILRAPSDDPAAVALHLERTLARLRREGRLPWGGPGEAVAGSLRAEMAPVLAAWADWQRTHLAPAERAATAVRLDLPGAGVALRVDAGLLPWRLDGAGQAQLLRASASRLGAGKSGSRLRADKLVAPWLDQLALGAAGRPCGLCVLGTDRIVRAAAVPEAEARAQLAALAAAWLDGTGDGGPWPTALSTGLAWLAEGDPRAAYESSPRRRGDDQDPHLARLFPTFADLAADARFEPLSAQLYAPFARWLGALQAEPLPDAVVSGDDDEAADD